MVGVGSPARSPLSRSRATIASRAENVVLPASSEYADDGRDQLRPGRLDEDRLRPVEGDPVVVAGVLTRLQLGLRDRGLERDVPQGGRLLEVRLAAAEVAQERALGDGLRLRTDGRVA